MNMHTRMLVLFQVLTVATMVGAAQRPERMLQDLGGRIHGRAITPAKTLGDTIYLIGNPRDPDQESAGGVGPLVNGTFEDQYGNPGWFGWTHEDLTAYAPESFWHVSEFNAVSGTYSMWCGTYFEGDPGYGNRWRQNLTFAHSVDDNTIAHTVDLRATVRNDTEPGYDYTYVEYNADGVWHVWNSGGYDGDRVYYFDDSVVYQPGDYGGSGDEIQIRIRFESDDVWSDEDGLWDTDGACQIDDIEVRVDGVLIESEDFEDGPDGTYSWVPSVDTGVGDFAALYTNLYDLDPCFDNHSPQIAFIDNGVVVPGTGGTSCISWCYGHGGYIVNNTGGLLGPGFNLRNAVWSPPLAWPAGIDAVYLEFEMYTHELSIPDSSWPNVRPWWLFRSVATGDPADLEDADYDAGGGYYGPPEYWSDRVHVGDLIEPGCTHVQMGLAVWDHPAWTGTDGTPAPYLDNVRLVAYPVAGPEVSTVPAALFNDNFPAAGDLDFIDLGNNDVRLDMAANIAPGAHLVNDPGDSIWIDVAAIRAGSVLAEMPRLHVRMRANPLFDDVRVLPPNFSQNGNIVTGWVQGDSTFNSAGYLVEDRYHFDLPDEDFFYPGDVLRYYIEARDDQNGDIGITLLPGDTTGFHDFDLELQYPDLFTVQALPSMFSATAGDQPPIIFWFDGDNRHNRLGWHDVDDQNEWSLALTQLGFRRGVDYDLYFTRFPSGPLGQGLGGRATSTLLDGYTTLLYSSNFLFTHTLSNGDFDGDPSDDLQVISNWFGHGDKNAFMTGDGLVTSLLDAGAQGQAFVNDYFDVSYTSGDIRSLIGSQTAPTAAAVGGNGVIVRVPEWVVWGGCPLVGQFDAIEIHAGSTRLAEFTDPSGNPGIYPFAAASYHVNASENARVVLMPYDFKNIWNAGGWPPPAGYEGISARAIILEDILDTFGELHTSDPIAVAPDLPLTVAAYPNPFNPATTIALTLPRTGDVSVMIYGLRGELIRTLVDDRLEAGTHEIVWEGKADRGNQVASGIYFCETRAAGEVRINKLALVK